MGSTAVLVGACGGFVGGAVVGAAIGGAAGAVSGAIGGAVLQSAGYSGYSVLEATQMGAAGTAVIEGALAACGGGLVGTLVGVGVMSGDNSGGDGKKKHFNAGSGCGSVVGYTAGVVLGGLTGWGMFNAASQTTMELGQTAAALAVGGAISAIPFGLGMLCLCVPLICCGMAAVSSLEHDIEKGDVMSPKVSPV